MSESSCVQVDDISRAHDEAVAIATSARELALWSRVTEAEAANAIVTTIVAFERAEVRR